MQSDTNPIRESYLKFNLQPLAGRPISLARLRMFVTNASGNLQNIKQVADNSWTENSLTFNNAPAKGAIFATFTPASDGWIEINVTPYVASKAGSFASLAIDPNGNNNYFFSSAESSNPVQLVINHGGPTPTPTPAPTPSPTPTSTPGAAFSFGVAGDLGQNSNTTAVLNAVNSSGVNFFLAIGDLSYVPGNQETAWCNFVKGSVGSSTYPFELVAGNHEDDGPDGQIDNFAACLPHRLTHSYRHLCQAVLLRLPRHQPTARFINISPDLTLDGSTWDYSAGSSRYNWTASAIDSARRQESSGSSLACTSTVWRWLTCAGCEVSSDLMNLLDQQEGRSVLPGARPRVRPRQAARTPDRLHPVSPGSFDADCVVDAASPYSAGAGTVIVTSGAGGQSINSVNTADPEAGYFASWMGSNANPTYGFLKVTVTATSLSAQFVRGAGGSYTDSFIIQ